MANRQPPAQKPGTITGGPGTEPLRGPGGIPLAAGVTGSEIRGLQMAEANMPRPLDPDVARVFSDTSEEVDPVAFDDGCRCHRWFVDTSGGEWMASEVPSTDPRRKPGKGERFIVVTLYGDREHVTRYAATRADRTAHLAELARAEHVARHPEDGDYWLVADVPRGWPADVRDIIAQWRERTIRPVVLGGHVSLQVSGGSWTAQASEGDVDAVRRYEPLLVAELEGRTLPCSVAGCTLPARAMARVSVPICLEHLALPVGADPSKPGRFRAAAAAIASAVGG